MVLSLYSIGRLLAWKVSKVIAPLPPDGIQDHTWGAEVFASQSALSESITCCYDYEEKGRPKGFSVKAFFKGEGFLYNGTFHERKCPVPCTIHTAAFLPSR
jgi:hypothetical protein